MLSRFCTPANSTNGVLHVIPRRPFERPKEAIATPLETLHAVLFVLEYAVRYLLVPGRVENWILIVDLSGVGLGCTPLLLSYAAHATAVIYICTRYLCARHRYFQVETRQCHHSCP